MTTNEPPTYPGDSDPGDTNPPPASGDAGTSGPPSYGSIPPPEGSTPPPPPPPPSAPGGSAEGFSATDAIGWGWGKFKENVGQSLLAVLLLIVVSVVLGGIGSIVAPDNGMFDPSGSTFDYDGGSFVASFIVGVIVSAVSYIVTVAISRATLDVADGARFDIGAAFGKVDVSNALVAGLIVGLLTQIGFALLFLPGLVVAFFTYFTSYFVAEGSKPVDAVQKSFSLVSANLGGSLVLAILSILVLILGVIALCVGIFVAIPVTFLAAGYAFRKFNGQPVQPVAAG